MCIIPSIDMRKRNKKRHGNTAALSCDGVASTGIEPVSKV